MRPDADFWKGLAFGLALEAAVLLVLWLVFR